MSEKAANDTEQLFTDSLGSYLNPDARVYDQIEEDEDLIYVSMILRLNENYLENDENYEHIKSATAPMH